MKEIRNPTTRTVESGIRLASLLGLLLVLAWIPMSASARADSDSDSDSEKTIPLSEADLFFELNDSDGDLGIHANLDGEPWKRLVVTDPEDRRMLDIRARSRLRRQGLTQLSFESAEPVFEELEPRKFFNRFPEGEYEIEAHTLEGPPLESDAEVTHLLPAPPAGIEVSGTPILAEEVDCEEGPLPLVSEPVIVRWDPVTHSHPELGRTNEPIEVVKYQLVVERDDGVFSVELPPAVTQLGVPPGFTALGQEFKLEILVKEASGNQTAVETCFALDL